jgi:hypothetical protein
LDFEKVKDLKIFNQHEKRENNSWKTFTLLSKSGIRKIIPLSNELLKLMIGSHKRNKSWNWSRRISEDEAWKEKDIEDNKIYQIAKKKKNKNFVVKMIWEWQFRNFFISVMKKNWIC